MKKWILLLVFVLGLALLLFRERYTNYEEALEDVGQAAGYINPTCSDPDYVLNSDYTECVLTKDDGTKDVKQPTCPEGTSYTQRGNAEAGDALQGVCEPTGNGPSAAEGTQSTPAETPSSTEATGSTTGGSSTSSRGSTATTGSGKGVWGPAFIGFGENGGPSSGDSTKTTQYPTLLGGFMGSKPSSMIPGVGVVSPTTPGLSIPSSASMGSDANSGYLPYSRQPGDMDLIPDPYRVSSTFSTSSYSSKKEPVPFLTDFSAFMK